MTDSSFQTIQPKILYFGTPVALISSYNEDESTNLAPISSFWALGWTMMLGLLDDTKTAENLGRHPECVVNIPSPDLWRQVEDLASLTGKNPVPDPKAKQFHFEKLRPIGIDVPVYPLKGYSLTVPIRPGDIAPRVSVTDFARKVVYARLGERMRVAGMADMAGYSNALDHRRLNTLRLESEAVFPKAGDYSAADEWAGLRPATPSGMPIVGSTPFNNLWLNVGQGALGFTLATGCAQLLNDLIGQRPPAIDCSVFNLGAHP